MITVNLTTLAKSLNYLKLKKKQVEADADKRYRQKIYHLAVLAAKVSPQFSGDFASNWNLAVDGNMPVYRPWAAKFNVGSSVAQGDNGQYSASLAPHRAGDLAAIDAVKQRIAGQLARVTRKNRVHLVNATDLESDGTNMVGPDGSVRLREVNVIPGNVRIESYLRAHAKEAIAKEIP